MNDLKLFSEMLSDNGWSPVHDAAVLHQPTGDGNVVKQANAYFMLQPQPDFQAGLALFEGKGFIRLRLYNSARQDFNWLQIEYNGNLSPVLDEIIAMQNELPSKSYFSLMSGAFKSDCQVSLLAWEQF